MPVLGSARVPADKVGIELSTQKTKVSLFDFLQINLRLILVSGKTKEYLFSPRYLIKEYFQFMTYSSSHHLEKYSFVSMIHSLILILAVRVLETLLSMFLTIGQRSGRRRPSLRQKSSASFTR